jgi:hypothetical protein
VSSSFFAFEFARQDVRLIGKEEADIVLARMFLMPWLYLVALRCSIAGIRQSICHTCSGGYQSMRGELLGDQIMRERQDTETIIHKD